MNRRLWTLFSALALGVGVLTPSAAAAAADDPIGLEGPAKVVGESTTGSYIIVMTVDPLVATEGPDGLNTASALAQAADMEDSHEEALRDAGVPVSAKVQDFTVALNGFSAVLDHDEAVDIAAQKEVALVLPDEMRHALTDSSPAFLGLTGPGGAHKTGVDGRGVVVGVIDTGIWPEHPSFADDGSYPAPPAPIVDVPDHPACDFGNAAHNPDDDPFECNNKLIGARQMLATYRTVIGADPDEFDSARDDNGHGSHTASTAAGNRRVKASIYGEQLAKISGIAPRAHIVAYKALGNQGGFTSDLAAAINQAVADGVDVINYSIGGGASLLGGDDIAFLFAADAGVFVATSAGNSGPGDGTIGGPASVPWITSVGANTQKRFFEGTAVLGDGSKYDGASITREVGPAPLIDAEFAGGDLCVPETLDSTVVTGKIVLCRRGAVGRAAKSLAVFQAGGIGMIMYNTTDDDNLFTDNHWVPSVHIDLTPGLEVKSYIASDPAPTARIKTGKVTRWDSAPSMTIFSSRGPNTVAEDIIKPDITGPGIQILAANSPFPDPASTPPGELFQAIAGTSMSSPHIAGLFALLAQKHPDWSAAAAKSALMTTTDQDVVDNDRVSQAGPFAMGSGHADPGRPTQKGSAFQPGLVYDAGFDDYLGFLCDAAPEVFSDPAATCALLESLGFATDASDLNYPSIGVAELTGSQTVTRTVTSVAREKGNRWYKVSVDEPAGYDVDVSPKFFKIKSGETVSYEVTITNDGTGPIGEWRSGSLTWRSNSGYEVYSPIAVNGALFDAQASVAGSGEGGSASFDVKFGYSGSYAAAPHGLEPAVVTSDNVLQDPDQTFTPSDVGAGGADLHEFTLSGAAFFRVAIPPEATEANADLDVYVYDPDGVQVASSTLGGTDEEVDIFLPADGTWSVYVHGWSAPGGDSDYDMYGWVISATPGGSLAVDAAPGSATIGTVGTVDVTWSGATLGEWHLGAVSHTGDVGLMGLTLVDVDNR